MRKITIIGASGHGKVISDIARLTGYDYIDFLDDDTSKKNCGQYPVVGTCSLATKISNDIFVAIGNDKIRSTFISELNDKNIPTLIHPKAILSDDISIGNGTVIMAGTVINPNVTIGKGCIINTSSSIDHDSIIGDYVHVAVGSHICGAVKIESNTWIGAGSTIVNNVNICSECIIGAGAVVINDITTPGTYVGVPAKKIK